MTDLHTEQNFATRFADVASLAKAGASKDRMTRSAHRIQRMAEEPGVEWFQILLEADRLQTSFESPTFFHEFSRLSFDDQKRLHLGNQFLNAWDGYPCVLVGGWAKQCFSQDTVLNLVPQMVYVMPFNFDRFLKFVTSPENVAKDINAVVAPDGHSFTIESHGCTVFEGKSSPVMANVMHSATYCRLLNNNVLVSPDERLFDIV